jgi:hypothetical protein
MSPCSLFDELEYGDYYVLDCHNGDIFRAWPHFQLLLGEREVPPRPDWAFGEGTDDPEDPRFLPFFRYLVNCTNEVAGHHGHWDSPYRLPFDAWQTKRYSARRIVSGERLAREFFRIVECFQNLNALFCGFMDFYISPEVALDGSGRPLERFMDCFYGQFPKPGDAPDLITKEVADEAARVRLILFRIDPHDSEDHTPLAELPEA